MTSDVKIWIDNTRKMPDSYTHSACSVNYCKEHEDDRSE